MTAWTPGLLRFGYIAGFAFFIALLLAGSRVPGYDHALHSVGMLAAVPGADARTFEVLGLQVSGMLLALFALGFGRVLRREGAGLAARLGADLWLISGVAFFAQGVFPMDLSDGDGAASQRHVAALTTALLSAFAAMALLAAGLRGRPGWRAVAGAGAAGALLLAALVLWPPHGWVPGWEARPGWSQRLALAVYFAFPALAGVVALRRQSPR